MADRERIWVAFCADMVVASTSLKGIADGIGAKYPTVKSKGKDVEEFKILISATTLWTVRKVDLVRIEGRGGKRAKGFLGYRK